MRTTHQFVDKYPILPNSLRLILGTIHPHDTSAFEILFFYGNRSSLWKILNDAFPRELGPKINLEHILKFLDKKRIAISDVILECTRTSPTALDQDLKPEKLNVNLIEQIRNSQITEILFTSSFGKNNAFKLFYVDLLGQKITQEIRDKREVELDRRFFGRPVKLKILYSPSGAANTGIVKSKLYLTVKHQYSQFNYPVKAFKIDYYRHMFA